MKDYPEYPAVSDTLTELLEQGHLWIHEYVAGVQLRFQLTEYGTLRIGDSQHIYDLDNIPLSHRHATRHIRERLNRETLQAAVEDVTEIVFFGQATIHQGVPYDWERLPSFLGFDIWHAGREQFLSVGAVDSIYQQLDLHSVNTVAQEVHVRDFDLKNYEFPASEWYDGPVAGIVIRNKRGGWVQRSNPAVKAQNNRSKLPESPVALARHLATDRRLSRVVSNLESQSQPVGFEVVRERLFETIVREEYQRLFEGNYKVDVKRFRSEIGNIVGEYLSE